MFWKHDPSPSSSSSSDEDSDSIESPENGNGQSSQNNRRNGTKDVVDVHEDGASAEESNDALSAMNSSTVSEDQVLRQLVSPIPRQVRFQLPSHSHHSTHISQNHNQNQNQNQFQRPSAASASSSLRRSSPYVAPLPPSSTLMQMQMGQQYKDPLATVSDYLDNVVLPRGGECTNVEALGLSMLIQSSVKGVFYFYSSLVFGLLIIVFCFQAWLHHHHLLKKRLLVFLLAVHLCSQRLIHQSH